ncbi:hypothetical protein BH20ACT11_BH20ACT11_05740 [soil metagenome]
MIRIVDLGLGDADSDREVIPYGSPHDLGHLDAQAYPVLYRTAVLVLAMVGVVGQKLIQEIPVGPVQLDAVEADLARSPGGRDEGFYDLGYPLVAQLFG